MNSNLMARQIVTDYYDQLAKQIISYTNQQLTKYTDNDRVDDNPTVLRQNVDEENHDNDDDVIDIDIPDLETDVDNIWDKTNDVFNDPFKSKCKYKYYNNVQNGIKKNCAQTRKLDLIFETSNELLNALRVQEEETMIGISRLPLNGEMDCEQIRRLLFANKSVFLIINDRNNGHQNRDPLNLHLVVLDFYFNEAEEKLLKYFDKLNFKLFGEMKSAYRRCIEEERKKALERSRKPIRTARKSTSPIIRTVTKSNSTDSIDSFDSYDLFDQNYMIAILVEKYIVDLIEKYDSIERVIQISEHELTTSIRCVILNKDGDLNLHFMKFVSNIDLDLESSIISHAQDGRLCEHDFSKIKSLYFNNGYRSRYVDVESLRSLNGLKFLSLTSVKLFENSFASLFNLSKLSLINCSFNHMPSDVFQHLPNLVVLSCINAKNLDKLNLINLTKLKWLTIEVSSIPSVEFNQELVVLELTRSTFINRLKHPKIRALNLSGTDLSRFNLECLCGLPNLEFLKMNDCSIEIVKFENTGGRLFSKLKSLDLSFNKINFIESLAGLHRLEKLHLSQNRIVKIEKQRLGKLRCLKELYLDNNQFWSLDPEIFLQMPQLETLDLSYNKNFTFASNLFLYLSSSLKKLVLKKITRLNSIYAQLFVDLVNLETLDLSINHTYRIHSGAFAGLGNIREIILSNNKIKKIDPDVFRELKLLRKLVLPSEVAKLNPTVIEELTSRVPELVIEI